MSVLFNGDLTLEQFERCLSDLTWLPDALVLAFAADSFCFSPFNGWDPFLSRTDQGRIFCPQGECQWRRLRIPASPEDQEKTKDLMRLVYLGESHAFPEGFLEEATHLLQGLKPVQSHRYLWGERTDLENEWIEQQVPHRFVYPISTAKYPRGRVRLVVEEWLDQSGDVVFSRFHHIEETEGE